MVEPGIGFCRTFTMTRSFGSSQQQLECTSHRCYPCPATSASGQRVSPPMRPTPCPPKLVSRSFPMRFRRGRPDGSVGDLAFTRGRAAAYRPTSTPMLPDAIDDSSPRAPAGQHGPGGMGAPCGQVRGWPRNAQILSVAPGERMCSNLQACCSISDSLSMARLSVKRRSASR